MSFQTTVLVDGEWTTRNIDIHEVMARNRQQTNPPKAEAPPKMPDRIPELGILSRTVIRSPLVHWILPARIRHCSANDAVFVGDDAVHIKEILADCRLSHVASKTDFGSRIKATRVFGERRKFGLDISIKEEGAEEDQIIPPQVIVLTLESKKLMFLYAEQSEHGDVTFHQSTIALPTGKTITEQPGKYLAVDPKSRAIAVSAFEGGFIIYSTKSMAHWREDTKARSRSVTPIVQERALSIDDGVILKMEFLSPRSEDDHHVILLVLFVHRGRTKVNCYDWDCSKDLRYFELRTSHHPVDPSEQNPELLIPLQRRPDFILVAGSRCTMYRDILSGFPTRQMLILDDGITERGGDSKRKPLRTQWARMSRHSDWQYDAFYLAREDGLVQYMVVDKNRLDLVTEAGRFNCAIDSAFSNLELEHADGKPRGPDILVAAGVMCNGELYSIGQKNGTYAPEVLGRQEAMKLNLEESIPNWTPVADMILTELPGLAAGFERNRQALFITNGRAPHGTVSELRLGLNASTHTIVNLEGMAGINNLWVFRHQTSIKPRRGALEALVLLSLPPANYLCRIEHAGEDQWDIKGVNERECGLDLDNETLAACCFGPNLSAQITRKRVHLLGTSINEAALLPSICSFEFPSSTSVLAGTLNHRFQYIVLVSRDGPSTTTLRVTRILETDGEFSFGEPLSHPLSGEPTSLYLLERNGQPLVFVGTTDMHILFYRICDEGLKLSFDGYLAQSASVCESVALIADRTERDDLLLCGMRHGSVFGFNLQNYPLDSQDTPVISMTPDHTLRMGHTSARIFRNETDKGAAFVSCGQDFCRIRVGKSASSPLSIDSVWFSASDLPGYHQSAVSAMAQFPYDQGARQGLSGHLCALSGTKLLISHLDIESRAKRAIVVSRPLTRNPGEAIPRRLETNWTPHKLIYLRRSRMMVVAMQNPEEVRPSTNDFKGYRRVHSAIALLRVDDDLNEQEIKQEEQELDERRSEALASNRSIIDHHLLRPYERVYALLDWTYEAKDGNKYGFIIVGTGVVDGQRGEIGRILYFRIDFDANGKAKLKLKKEKEVDQPVYSMAMFDERTIVYSCGKALQFEEYKVHDKKWIKTHRIELPSAGIHVTAWGSMVHVSTAQDSVMVFRLIPSDNSVNQGFERVLTDSLQRNCAYHLLTCIYADKPTTMPQTQPGPTSTLSPAPTPQASEPTTLILVADKKCTLTALLHPMNPTVQNAAPTLFQANLSRSITRLRAGNIRPLWHQSDKEINGVLQDDLVGSCVDGTVFAFTVLNAPAFRLLKLLEKLVFAKEARDPAKQDDKIVLPESTFGSLKGKGKLKQRDSAPATITFREVDPEPGHGQARPRGFHVDGDALTRFLRDMDDGELERLVYEGTQEDVGRVFEELVEQVVGGSTREERVREAVSWLRDVLRAVL